MGRILSIRLSASTYNTDDVFRAWPHLCSLAWPGRGELVGAAWRPSSVSGALAPPIAVNEARFGVLDLVRDLMEEFRFGDWDDETKKLLESGMDDLHAAETALVNALADWQPQSANRATDDIEDALDKLERVLDT